jgi:hypothetical protein
MALLKGIFSSSRRHKDAGRDPLRDDSNLPHGPETMPVMMNLEERMAFRRELLFESIRVSMNQRFIAPNAYRAKVMRVDKRGHSFIVMFDMSPTFMLSPAGQRTELVATAALLTQNAKNKYGLVVGGVYWRIDETLDTEVAHWARPSAPAPLEQPGPTAEERRLANIEKYDQVSAEEMAEFEAAWQKQIALKVGERTYVSDLTPLAEDPPPK